MKRQKRLPLLWAVLAAVLGIATLISLHTGSITGNVAIQTISYAAGGSQLFFEVRNVPGVKEVTITFREQCKQCLISFTENPAIPFQGIAYSKFEVASPDEEKIGRMNYTLKLDKEELQRLHLKAGEVQLYVNGKKTPITLLRETETHLFYQSFSGEMGHYVIGKRKELGKEEDLEETRSSEVPAEQPDSLTEPELPAVEDEMEDGVENGQDIPLITDDNPLAGAASSEEQPPTPGRFWTKIKAFFNGLF